MNADLLVLSGAALSGLMGGAHCAAMCGGIATSFAAPGARASWLDALEPNVGRLLGYGIGGGLAGAIGAGFLSVAASENLGRALRAAVGIVLVAAALRLLDRRGRLRFLAAPARWSHRWLAPLQHRFTPRDRGLRRLVAGMVWGWLPCGLSGTVLLAAALQGNALHGAMTMLAFGLGTAVTMVPLTWSGARLGQFLQHGRLRIPAATLVLLAGVLTLAAPWLNHSHTLHEALAAIGCRSLG